MIQLFYNSGMIQYELYLNGVLIGGVREVKVHTGENGVPAATIVANVEIVNEQPATKGKVQGNKYSDIPATD